MKRRIRRRPNVTPDLDITAFMNLMVILVPFLLITAVFSRVTVLDLYLPPESSESSLATEKFRLEIVLRKEEITVYEASSGMSAVIKAINGQFDYVRLGDHLAMLKKKFPGKRAAAILPEPDVSYDVLVQVMDHVRMRETNVGTQSSKATKTPVSTTEELFPGISIGDAPDKKGARR